MRILVAEDSAIYQHLIRDCLIRWNFEVILATDGAAAWRLLQQANPPRLVLLDWVLPGMDGIEICQRIRSCKKAEAYTYVVLLTGRNRKEDLLEGMGAGADDFLAKPFDELELRARLFVGKRILELQEELVAARESLRFAATHDALTGMWNRPEILKFLGKELTRGKRERRPVGLALVDIDHFKRINDSLGHLAGDCVIRQVANLLCSRLRPYDGFGRYGGEEFLIVLPGCDLDTTLRRADEIRELISSAPASTAKGNADVTVSMGVISADPTRDHPVTDLLSHADQALYLAKTNGRNRVEKLAASDEPASAPTTVRR